jgi:hypothetical protein
MDQTMSMYPHTQTKFDDDLKPVSLVAHNARVPIITTKQLFD